MRMSHRARVHLVYCTKKQKNKKKLGYVHLCKGKCSKWRWLIENRPNISTDQETKNTTMEKRKQTKNQTEGN